jgi:hypothetical protein
MLRIAARGGVSNLLAACNQKPSGLPPYQAIRGQQVARANAAGEMTGGDMLVRAAPPLELSGYLGLVVADYLMAARSFGCWEWDGDEVGTGCASTSVHGNVGLAIR